MIKILIKLKLYEFKTGRIMLEVISYSIIIILVLLSLT